MSYEKQTWIDGVSPLNAERLNHMEEGIFAAHGSKNEPADNDIPKVFLSGDAFGDMTIDKNEVNMMLEYISKTDRFTAGIKIKFQGSSSLSYPKKNFTIKMYTDDTYETKLKKRFKDWNHESNKYVLKANYIDHSHARNIVSAKLWSEVVASRSDYDALPVEMRNSPRNGAIDGFPIKLYVNGTYQGIYTWNIGKDDWMWGMDEDNPNHVLMCGEINTGDTYAETPCNFRSLWNGVDGTAWSVEVGTNSTELKNSLNNLIQFVMDNEGDAFRNGIGNYLDVQSAIDYYLFMYAICSIDNLGKNMLLATYDGTKWICGAYDMDSTYGLWWTGMSWLDAHTACPNGYQEKYSLLWERISTLFADEMQERYHELRKSVLSYANMVTNFELFTDLIGSELYAEDAECYLGIPNADTNNIKQIRNFVRDRLNYCDNQFALDAAVAEYVDYIESDGESWIDTRIIPDSDMVVECGIFNPEQEMNYENYFGTYGNDFSFANTAGTPTNWVNLFVNGTNHTDVYFSEQGGGYYPMQGIQRDVVIDITKTGISWTSTESLWLFAKRNNAKTGPDVPGTFRLSYAKITRKSTNEVLLDMLPAVDADGKPGMYDSVSKKMFYNAGSGTFAVPAT